jgi:hypothetical protein
VATLAFSLAVTGLELAAVIIRVTVHTASEPPVLGLLSVSMAHVTRNFAVLANKRKPCLRMVERCCFDIGKAARVVACLAIFAQASLVRLLVTARAVLEINIDILHKRLPSSLNLFDFRVTLLALDVPVLTDQCELGLVVVESGSWFERFEIVAFRAIFLELTSMLVEMAPEALLVQPQKRPLHIDIVIHFYDALLYVFRLVTLPAIQGLVNPSQLEPGPAMVKHIAATLPVNELELPPRMLAVTLKAAPTLLRYENVVQPLLVGNTPRDRLVTIKTFVGGWAGAQRMAFEAVLDPFEALVGFGQLPR